LINSNLLNFFEKTENNLIIAANLPYLDNNQIKLNNLKKEPKLALWGGLDGLDLYRLLFKQLKKLNLKNNLSIYIEINPFQSREIKKIIKKNLPKMNIEIKK